MNSKWTGTCEGEVLPSAEACNGKDDDCDGRSDEGLSNCGRCSKANMLLLVDTSGAMGTDQKLTSLQTAVGDIVHSFQYTIRFGLMSFAGSSAKAHLLPNEGAAHVAGLLKAVGALRASGSAPMRTAVTQAYNYFSTQVIPLDPLKARPQYLVLMTDGASTDGDPSHAIKRLRNVVVGGLPYDIRTFVIGIGSGRNILPASLTMFAQAGGTGKYYHESSRASIKKALSAAANRVTKEVCDRVDNDCDGLVDEGNPCAQGLQCRQGACK